MDFIWEAGKTYRTMVPGITATVSAICEAGGYVVAKINSPMGRYDGGELFFNDGELHAFRISDGGVLGFKIAEFPKMPHLASVVVPEAIVNCPWKVGRTYKTTVPGTVATIDWIYGHSMSIRGRINGEAAEWNWHLDGKLFGFRNHKEIHHLLTEEADPPVNAKASGESGGESVTQGKLLERIAKLEKELEATKEVRKVVNGDGTVTWHGLRVVAPSRAVRDGEIPIEVRSMNLGISGRWITGNGHHSDTNIESGITGVGELRFVLADKPKPPTRITWTPPASLPNGEYLWKRGELWNAHSKRMIAHVTIEAWLGADFTAPPKDGRYRKEGRFATWIGDE